MCFDKVPPPKKIRYYKFYFPFKITKKAFRKSVNNWKIKFSLKIEAASFTNDTRLSKEECLPIL